MGVQLVQVGLGERGEPDDPRVVDDPVDAAEGLQGAVDDRLPAVRGGDVARIGDGRATGGDDLLDDRPRGVHITAAAAHRSSEVVHHHGCAA